MVAKVPTAAVFLCFVLIFSFFYIIVPRKTQSRVKQSATVSAIIASKTNLRDCVWIVKIVQKIGFLLRFQHRWSFKLYAFNFEMFSAICAGAGVIFSPAKMMLRKRYFLSLYHNPIFRPFGFSLSLYLPISCPMPVVY